MVNSWSDISCTANHTGSVPHVPQHNEPNILCPPWSSRIKCCPLILFKTCALIESSHGVGSLTSNVEPSTKIPHALRSQPRQYKNTACVVLYTSVNITFTVEMGCLRSFWAFFFFIRSRDLTPQNASKWSIYVKYVLAMGREAVHVRVDGRSLGWYFCYYTLRFPRKLKAESSILSDCEREIEFYKYFKICWQEILAVWNRILENTDFCKDWKN